jgi:hypothetical protein
LNTEHIYIMPLYGGKHRTETITLLQDMGAYQEGDTWVYTNLSQGKTYVIHFVENIEEAKLALYTDSHIIFDGHSNYGLGGIFLKPGEYPTTVIPDIYFIDDIRIWNYSSPWVGVSVRGMVESQAYPNWWPIFQDETDGIMPYEFHDPRGNPPYNYYITYRVPGDPSYFKVESSHNSAYERFPDSGAMPWYSPDGSPPDPGNPAHLNYFITNPDTSGDYRTCGASPCPKPHYGSRTIVFRKDLEVDVTKLKFRRMLIETCTSSQYYLDTFQRGIIFFTVANSDGSGLHAYLRNYLEGKSDEDIWAALGDYQGIYNYHDFSKRPSEQ